jgi:hypothetical protein
LVDFDETAGVKEQVEPLAGRELAALALAIESLGSTAQLRAFFES